MFQFPGFPTYTYVFSIRSMVLHHGGFPIRKSADRSLFAAPRGLSQLVTSFIGSWCQGIHLMLLFAWTSQLRPIFRSARFSCSYLNCLSFLKTWILQQKGFPSCLFCFASLISQRLTKLSNSALAEFCYPLIGKTWSLVLLNEIRLCPLYLFFHTQFFALFDFQWAWTHVWVRFKT